MVGREFSKSLGVAAGALSVLGLRLFAPFV